MGGENIAALRERMSQMQLQYNQSQQQLASRRTAAGSAAPALQANAGEGGAAEGGVGVEAKGSNGPAAFSPLEQGASGASDLESLQKRLQMLNSAGS